MITDATQIKVTIPNSLFDFLASKADKFGLTTSSYIKHLILNDVKDMEYPVYQASSKTEASYKKALIEKDQAIEVDDLTTFFKSL